MRSIVAMIPDIIAVLDAEGRCIEILAGEPWLASNPPQSLIGCTVDAVFGPELASQMRAVIAKTLETNTPQQFEYAVPHEQHVHWFSARVAPYGTDERRLVVWVSRDITRQKRAEEELCAAAARLAESQRLAQAQLRHNDRLITLGALAAEIAHELSNPISAAWTAAETAISVKDHSTDVLQECLETVVESVRRCQKIIENVLRFARQEPSAKEPHDFNAIVLRAVEATHSLLDRCQVEVVLHLAEELPQPVVNAVEIEQVIVNLIRNAALAGQAGRIDLRTESEPQSVRLSVCDNGCGISAHDLGHIFDPFFSRRESGEGTGLGLTISRGIVEDHRGTISAESAVGQGTNIILRLPLS